MAATIQSYDSRQAAARDCDWIQASERTTFIALAAMAAMTVILGIILLAVRWDAPLLGMHSFRQSQTAITSYWILKGSPWLAYQTPVLGAPWSIPFEFPIYQLLVAGVVKLTGLPLDPTGRVISYLFLVLTILPVRSLAHAYGLTDRDVLVFAILLLASPIYMYWGTTFLIETMVLFFCVAFLAAIERTARDGKLTTIAEAALLGSVGALGKITTFAPFYLLAGVILLRHIAARAPAFAIAAKYRSCCGRNACRTSSILLLGSLCRRAKGHQSSGQTDDVHLSQHAPMELRNLGSAILGETATDIDSSDY
jgi:hypothetical protein